jgi:SAM-dependent methyltransferase
MWNPLGEDPRPFMLHRKMWEWLFIAEALSERDLLRPGRTGVGFGVGKEPLVALFAASGCDVVATDAPPEVAEATGWTDSSVEWAGGLAGLNDDGLCPPDQFAEHVRYRHVDMNALPKDLRDFDFSWSSCAFEHLGSLAAGADFVVAQMRCLKPGGIAVHTTEYTVSSNTDTIETGGTVLYRRRDIEALVERLQRAGHTIDVDYTEGTTPEDLHVDTPPYTNTHLRTTLGEYVTTSLALIIEKSAARPSALRLAVRKLVGADRR